MTEPDPEHVTKVKASIREWAQDVLDRASAQGDSADVQGARTILEILDGAVTVAYPSDEGAPMSENEPPLAHNTLRTDGTVPVVVEYPRPDFPPPGERERDWHEASDEEYQAYLDYWNALSDKEDAERAARLARLQDRIVERSDTFVTPPQQEDQA